MNNDALALKKCIRLVADSSSDKRKNQKNKVFRKGELADIRNEFTKDWYIADLFDVTHLITCGVAKKPNYVEEGIPFLSAQNTRPFKTNLNKIRYISREDFEKLTVGGAPKKNDILYTRVGNCGDAAKIPYEFEFAIYVSLTLIKPVKSLLDSDYLAGYLNSHFGLAQASSGAIGIGLKNLNVDNVRRYIIPLPPLAEQKVIAEKLDAFLAQVDSIKSRLDAIPNILKRFRQSVLAAAVSGKLTEEWREIKCRNIDAWKLKSLSDVALVQTGNTPLKSERKYYDSGDIPWLTSSVTGQRIVTAAEQFVTPLAVEECRLKVFEPGTLLVAMYGEGKTRGQVTEIAIKATTNQACAAILVDINKANKNYVKLCIEANYEKTRMLAEGGNQPNLNLSKVRSIPIYLPPKLEQSEIIHLVGELFTFADKVEQKVNAAQERVNKLTQSILAKAFRGELTAEWREQNPDLISGKNSAEALLERIKLEREKLKTVKKTKTIK